MTEAGKKRVQPYLAKMAHFCSMQERAVSEVLQKLQRAPLTETEKVYIIDRLKTEGFVDEHRYARAFVNDKVKLNGWGRVKIAYALRMKQVDSEAVEEALAEIEADAYQQLAERLAEKKLGDTAPDAPEQEKKNKVARFLLQRGFEPELVWQVVSSLF